MNKKVLLIHPEISRTKYNFKGAIENEPLELEYIKSLLDEQGFVSEIFDRAVENQSVQNKISVFQPDVLYVCGRTRQENFMKEYCHMAKEQNPSVITILGGIHVQHNYQRFFTGEIDCILTSFDIYIMPKVISAFLQKDYDMLEIVSGICFQIRGKWIINPAEPFEINRLPLPNRNYFYEHTDSYRYLELYPCAHVRTSYSCVYNCKFCYRNKLNCGKYTSRDIVSVVDEIQYISCENIFIIDDDFLISPKRLEEFIRLIKERGIHKKYVCYGRADFIIHNKELIKQFSEIGCYYILTGLESTEDTRLKGYNKRTTVNLNIECIEFLNQTGINLMGMFILDLNFTAKDFRNLFKWIKIHNLKHVAVSIFTPEFNLDSYKKYEDRLISDNPEHWDYLHLVAKPENLSVFKYYFHYYKLLIKLFLLARKQGVYDFIDYNDYIKSFAKNIFRKGNR